jgi:ACR3 family arsenite efflux pump ArsB
MIYVFLFYILPLFIGVIGSYWICKLDGQTMGDFLKIIPYLLVPVLNILAIVAGIVVVLEDWWNNDETLQNFKNRKL